MASVLLASNFLHSAVETMLGADVAADSALLPLLGGAAALLAALVLTPLVWRWARRSGWMARPSEDRWHDEPVALLGGLALLGAVALAVVAAGGGGAYRWPVWVGAGLIFVVGLVDDLLDIRPEAKLIVQVVATALLLYAGEAFWRGGPFWASIPLTFLWVIGITNAVNLIDGLDGLAASIGAVAATTLAVIGTAIGQLDVAVVAAALAGGSLGFLTYNAKPARIFMGDCGSLFLGYMLAAAALGVQSTGEPVIGTLVPIVVLAVPIFDTTFVTVTRILGGRRVTQGGNDHTHHRLVRLGLSERGAVLGLSGVSTLFALSAVALFWATAQLFLAVLLLGGVGCVVFGLYLVESRSYEPEGDRAPGLTERIGAVMHALAGGVYWKSVGGVVADLLVVVAAFIVAAHLRYGGAPPPAQVDVMIGALPAIVVLKVGVFYAFGLYHGVWRHAGTPEAVRLLKASTLASGLALGGLVAAYGPDAVSVSVAILDWMIATGAVGGVRFGFRALRQYFAARRDGGVRTLVYGSGDQSVLVVRHLRGRGDRTVVGLLDNAARPGLKVQGVEVLGRVEVLPRLAVRHDVDELVIPVHDTGAGERQRLAHVCAAAGINCRHFTLALEPAGENGFLSPAGDGAQTMSG
ncbi:MAG: hypothetical protein ABEL97_11395 [Salinibacter sp.]